MEKSIDVTNCGIGIAYACAFYNSYLGNIEVPDSERSDYNRLIKKIEEIDDMESYDIPYYPESDRYFMDDFTQAIILYRFPDSMNNHHINKRVKAYLKAFELLRG